MEEEVNLSRTVRHKSGVEFKWYMFLCRPLKHFVSEDPMSLRLSHPNRVPGS